MKRTYFFATPSDIIPVLMRFEANAPLKFVALGNLTTPNRAIHLHASEIPNPGIATHETGNASMAYMVSLRDTKNEMHKFIDTNGETRWTLNNGDNGDSVVLTMAGLWKDGTLLPGLMDTIHQTQAAQQLMKWFLKALKQEEYVKIESWWLGKQAMAMLRSGKRLTTTAVQSPSEFDLKLPNDL